MFLLTYELKNKFYDGGEKYNFGDGNICGEKENL